MANDNFMNHLASDIHGLNIKPTEQESRKAIQESNECRREYEETGNNTNMGGPYDDWERRHALRHRLMKRGNLGGANFVPGDGISNL